MKKSTASPDSHKVARGPRMSLKFNVRRHSGVHLRMTVSKQLSFKLVSQMLFKFVIAACRRPVSPYSIPFIYSCCR